MTPLLLQLASASLHQPGGLEAWVMSTLRTTFGTSRCHGHAWQVGQTGTHARIAGLQETTNVFLSCPARHFCSKSILASDLLAASRKPFARQPLPRQSASTFYHLYDMSCVCHTLPGQVVSSEMLSVVLFIGPGHHRKVTKGNTGPRALTAATFPGGAHARQLLDNMVTSN